MLVVASDASVVPPETSDLTVHPTEERNNVAVKAVLVLLMFKPTDIGATHRHRLNRMALGQADPHAGKSQQQSGGQMPFHDRSRRAAEPAI